jgi:NADH-quinone oxidoreductase subunit H
LRAAAQLISYEVYFAFLLLPIFMVSSSLNMFEIIDLQDSFLWNFFFFAPLFVLFFVTLLAETNRVPFDLPEAESELVSGLIPNILLLYLFYSF